MNGRSLAQMGGALLVVSIAWPPDAIAQEGQVTLIELVSRIPIVAGGDDGMNGGEQALAEQLRAHGAEAIPRLLPLLEHEREAVRDLVGYTLSNIEGLNEEHLDALMKAQRKGNGWIAPAIGRIGGPRAIEFLVKDLERHPEKHSQVTHALKIAGEPAAIALALRFRVKRSEDFDECACYVFSELGERAAAAVGPLVDAALDRGLEVDLRQRAVMALGSCGMGARRMAPSLLALAATDPSEFQWYVEHALVEMHAPEAVPILMGRLAEGGGADVLQDLEPLGADGVAAGPLVVKLLDDRDHDLRVAAARALGYIGYATAIETLSTRTSDDDWQLAAAAIGSLVRLRATSRIEMLDGVAANHWSPFVRTCALRASRKLHAIADGTVDPYAGGPEEEDPYAPREISKEPMPALGSGFDALKGEELGRLTYTVEIASATASGRHVKQQPQHPGCGLRVDGGLLLGAQRGEWGGEVVHVRSGVPAQTVLHHNTVGIHRIGDTIVAVVGLAHMGTNYGELYRLDRQLDSSFTATWWKRLPGKPAHSGIREDGALFVRCSGGDVVVTPSGAFERAR